jgi:hypothetical protein
MRQLLSARGVAVAAGAALLMAAAGCTSAGGSADPVASGTATATGTPSPSAAPINLPRIPWAGGPAYYAKFPAAAAYGWTSPNFFPISVWDASVTSPADVAQAKAQGINTYLNLSSGDFAAIRAGGLSVVEGLGPTRGVVGPEVVGYDLTDEPDGWARAGRGPISRNSLNCSTKQGCGFTLMEYLDKIASARSSGRFTYTNYTGSVVDQPRLGASFLRPYQDVVSVDDYFYTGSGGACYVAKFYGLVKAGQCPKAADYGMDVARERAIVPGKPVWNYVELGTTTQGGGNITPGKVGGAVWSSIINGAMGINYFIEDTANGPCGEPGDVLADTSCAAAVASTREVTKVDAQIKSLAPVLNTQSFRYTFNPRLDTMLKYYDGSYYIFAMPGLAGGAGRYTLHLPKGMDAAQVRVIDEGRSIPIKNGSFTDSFSAEYAYHIYKITL